MGRHTAERIIVAALLVALGGSPASAEAGWQTFTHPKLGFSLSYPDGWDVTNGPTGVVFMAIGPAPTAGPRLRMNVNVTYEELPTRMTLEEYEAQNESGLGFLFNGYERLRVDRTTIGTYQAVLRYYTWKRDDGVKLYQIQLVTVTASHGYVVTGTTNAASAHLIDEAKLLTSILVTFRPQ
jgi:hypothetical protein